MERPPMDDSAHPQPEPHRVYDADGGLLRLGTQRRSANGYVRTTYSASEIDLFAIYCGELDRCFLLPVSRFEGATLAQLRLAPALNGQVACTNLADNFDFEGAVAQMGRAPAWHAGGQGFESPQLHVNRGDGPSANLCGALCRRVRFPGLARRSRQPRQ